MDPTMTTGEFFKELVNGMLENDSRTANIEVGIGDKELKFEINFVGVSDSEDEESE